MTGKHRDYLKSYELAENNCWNYTGSVNPKGYGRILQTTAHRFFYERLVGPIAPGLHIDHLCENTRCVNPDHLEPVTPLENAQRRYRSKGHCEHERPAPSVTVRPRGDVDVACEHPPISDFSDIFERYFGHIKTAAP